MIDWESWTVLGITDYIWCQLTVFLLGVYSWHFVITLRHVELPLLFRRINFRWAYVPYMVARFTTISFLIALVTINQMEVGSTACPNALKGLSVLGNLASAGASTNLFIRTFTLWKGMPILQGFLCAISAGQWVSAIATSIQNMANKLPTCGEADAQNTVRSIIAFYVYTVAFDFIILVFTCLALWKMDSTLRHSRLWTTLFRQGIWYFVTTLVVCLVVLIFAGLDLNPVMNIMFTIPAITISVIASSRAVIAFQTLKDNDVSNLSHHTHNTITATVSIGRFTTNVELPLGTCDDAAEFEARQIQQKAIMVASQTMTAVDARTRPELMSISLSDLEAGSSQVSHIFPA